MKNVIFETMLINCEETPELTLQASVVNFHTMSSKWKK